MPTSRKPYEIRNYNAKMLVLNLKAFNITFNIFSIFKYLMSINNVEQASTQSKNKTFKYE